MAQAAQTNFFETTATDYRVAACRRFPLSGAVGNIRGSGRYAAVNKCSKRWRVYLYPTEADRAAKLQEWQERGCGPDCRSDHERVDLTP
jgi:hypothetical protein